MCTRKLPARTKAKFAAGKSAGAIRFKALIPAAGEGRRLRPHTHATPKVLLEVAGKPIIGHIMDRLLPARPEEVVVVVGVQGGKIKSYLETSYRTRFRFVEQDDPKGLGDAVYRGRDYFGHEPILIVLGDTIVDLNMTEMVGHENLIGVKEVEDPRRFGIVELDGDTVKQAVEKPKHPTSNLAIVGLYYFTDACVLFDSLRELIQTGQRTRDEFQLTDALRLMLKAGTVMRAKRIDRWLDCGTPDALLATNRYLLARQGHYRQREGVVFVPPVWVHDDASIRNSVIGPNVSVGSDAEIHDSIIRDSIVNRNAQVEWALLERSILGEESTVRGTPRRLNLGGFSELEVI
ncbi:MAG: sugar phosphate nucleotidyltransferase [candidate division WOR-3 bacterium]